MWSHFLANDVQKQILKLLAIDTATEACSAALYVNGEITQQYQLAPRQHSHLILRMIDELLHAANCKVQSLDALAFARGPGSFMGLRIAAGVVQGISYAQAIPVVPVSTLAAIAKVAMDQTAATKVLAAIDARMDEVYWGCYVSGDKGLPQLMGHECVRAPAQVAVPEGDGWLAAGTGWSSYEEVLYDRMGQQISAVLPDCFPCARAVAELAIHDYEQGKVVTAAQAVPVYLRDDVAKKPASMTSSGKQGTA